MNYDDHCVCLGRLWGNLQSLEVTLRLFLTQANPSENYIISRDTSAHSSGSTTVSYRRMNLTRLIRPSLRSATPSLMDW